MMGVMEAFSQSYAQSRVKFLEAAATAGLQFESFNKPVLNKNDELRALDAAIQHPANGKASDKLLIINSANPDADSFGGSGVQVYVLHDAEWMEKVCSAGVSVLYLHGSDQSLAEVVNKHVLAAKKVVLLDISTANSLKDTVFEALTAAKLVEKCKFSAVKPIAAGAPAWDGQTISQARQALFKAVDSFSDR